MTQNHCIKTRCFIISIHLDLHNKVLGKNQKISQICGLTVMFIPWDPNLQNKSPNKNTSKSIKKMVGTNKTTSSLSTHIDPIPWISAPSISTCGNLSSICCTSGKGLMRTNVVTWSTYPPPKTPPNVPNPPRNSWPYPLLINHYWRASSTRISGGGYVWVGRGVGWRVIMICNCLMLGKIVSNKLSTARFFKAADWIVMVFYVESSEKKQRQWTKIQRITADEWWKVEKIAWFQRYAFS